MSCLGFLPFEKRSGLKFNTGEKKVLKKGYVFLLNMSMAIALHGAQSSNLEELLRRTPSLKNSTSFRALRGSVQGHFGGFFPISHSRNQQAHINQSNILRINISFKNHHTCVSFTKLCFCPPHPLEILEKSTQMFKKVLPKSCFLIGALKAGLLHNAVVSPTMPFKGDRSSWVTSSLGIPCHYFVKKNGAFWSCSHVELFIFNMYQNLYDLCNIMLCNIYIYFYIIYYIYDIPYIILADSIFDLGYVATKTKRKLTNLPTGLQ